MGLSFPEIDATGDLPPCKAFMVVPPYGEAFEDPELLARLQRELIAAFPDFQLIVMIEGAPGRYSDFFLVPVIIDYEGNGHVDSGPTTVSDKFLGQLANLLAPYVGSDKVSLVVKLGPSPDETKPTLH